MELVRLGRQSILEKENFDLKLPMPCCENIGKMKPLGCIVKAVCL